jgi:hypothetical protein
VHRVAEIMVYTAIALAGGGVGLFLLGARHHLRVLGHAPHRGVDRPSRALFFLIAIVAGSFSSAKVTRKPPMLDGTLCGAQEGPRALMRRRVVSARVKELAEREAQFARTLRRRNARALRAEVANIEGRFARIDASWRVARDALLHPAVIVGGIVALLTIVGRAACGSSAACTC